MRLGVGMLATSSPHRNLVSALLNGQMNTCGVDGDVQLSTQVFVRLPTIADAISSIAVAKPTNTAAD
jgi:hypothetical protein